MVTIRTFAILTLFVVIRRMFCCVEDIKRDESTSNNYYNRYHGYRERQIVKNCTIICEHLNSVEEVDLLYGFSEQPYDQFLKILNSNISVLPPSLLTRWRTIKKLYFNNIHVKKVLPLAFSGLLLLEELYLDHNELQVISAGVYNPLHKLQILDLSYNCITQIDEYSLAGLSSLKMLFLNSNFISVIENYVFSSGFLLSTLDLSQNPLSNVSFGSLKYVDQLLMLNTSLVDFPQKLNNFTAKYVDFSSNQFYSLDFSTFTNTTTLILHDNQIDNLENCNNENIIKLNLKHNFISNFNCTFSRVEILDLSFNLLLFLDEEIFENFENLTILNLEHNQISELSPRLFGTLDHLLILNISYNIIQEFKYGTFDALHRLKILDISHNKLLELHQYTLSSLSNLRNLYFDDNKISFFHAVDLKTHLTMLKFVSLKNNLWKCKDLVFVYQTFRNMNVEIATGHDYQNNNFHGITCLNQKNAIKLLNTSDIKFAENIQNIIDQGVKNSKMVQFFDQDFLNSKFFKYFDKDFATNKFFEFFSTYKVLINNINSNYSAANTPQKFSSIEVVPTGDGNKLLIVNIVFNILKIGVVGYLLLKILNKIGRKKSFSAESQIQLT